MSRRKSPSYRLWVMRWRQWQRRAACSAWAGEGNYLLVGPVSDRPPVTKGGVYVQREIKEVDRG